MAERPSARGSETALAAQTGIGDRVGEFELVELLGRGSATAVYRARDTSTGRFVVLKTVPPEAVGDAALAKLLRREGALTAVFHHPNVVPAIGVGDDQGRPYFVMELVAGESLASVLRREGRLAAGRALGMMKQVAAALAHVHDAGIIHCDLQPANLLVTPAGEVKLADFGLARELETENRPDIAGSPPDKPLYFPPEAARARPLDERSDLYMLGATFYHALAGRPPFEARDAIELALKHVRDEVPPLSQAAPDVPPELAQLIHHLLHKNPAERTQSAGDLLAALERIEAEMARAAAAAAPPARPGAAWLPERWLAPALVGGGVVLIVVAALLGVLLNSMWHLARPKVQADAARASSALAPGDAAPPDPESPTKGDARPSLPAWRAAWAQADAEAEALAKDKRFGAAIARYRAVAGRFGKEIPDELLAAAASGLRERAEAAFAAVAVVARQLVAERQYEAARGQLFTVIERYGLEELAAQAKELIASVSDTERRAREEAERARAQAERKARLERLREAEERYQRAAEPVEAMARAWEFRAALAALATLPFDELAAAPAATRRAELERLAALKEKILTRINTASPRLRKSALFLPGQNADLVLADGRGITARGADEKTDVYAWKDLPARSALRLAQLASDPNSGGDWLAIALLDLLYGEHDLAAEAFARARVLGAPVAAHLGPLAARALAEVRECLRKGQVPEARAALERLERSFGQTLWLQQHEAEVEAVRERIRNP